MEREEEKSDEVHVFCTDRGLGGEKVVYGKKS
jgi:hypothetical protein